MYECEYHLYNIIHCCYAYIDESGETIHADMKMSCFKQMTGRLSTPFVQRITNNVKMWTQ